MRWVAIQGYVGFYEVSDCGCVRSLTRIVNHSTGQQTKRGQLLKAKRAANGYLYVDLKINGKVEHHGIHRLVASHFLPPRPGEANHKDLDKENNHYTNLEWVTHDGNMKHAMRRGRMRKKLTEDEVLAIRSLAAAGHTQTRIAPMFGVSQVMIGKIIRREFWNWL